MRTIGKMLLKTPITRINTKQLYYSLTVIRYWIQTRSGIEWVLAAIGYRKIMKHIGFANSIEGAGLTVRQAPKSKNYRLVDSTGEIIYELHHEDIEVVTGVLVNGKLIPEENLETIDKPVERCEGCGERLYCVKRGVDPHDSVISICNSCAYFAREQGILEYVSYDECLQCTVMTCSNNPNKPSNRRNLKLLY